MTIKIFIFHTEAIVGNTLSKCAPAWTNQQLCRFCAGLIGPAVSSFREDVIERQTP
jgi:hypothetical protein